MTPLLSQRCRPNPLPGSHPRDDDRSRAQMSGSVRVARTGWGTGGHPGARSRAPLHPTATRADVTAPMTHRSPKRATIASRATPTAATTSPQTEPVAFGIDTSTPAATASATNQPRTTSARPPITRSHPRTVLAGIPNRAPISRCPPPAALATNAAQIRSATYALRSSNVTGNNTCVTAHRRHRDRRGRTGCAIPATRRTRAKPHPANTPSEHRRTRHLTSCQPGLDARRIDLYRDHQCLSHYARCPRDIWQAFSGGTVHPSVPRHTDGADHQPQTRSHPGHHIGTLTDGSKPRGRHRERRSTADPDRQ